MNSCNNSKDKSVKGYHDLKKNKFSLDDYSLNTSKLCFKDAVSKVEIYRQKTMFIALIIIWETNIAYFK